MFMLEEKINPTVATRPLPNLPTAGQVVARQAIGHLDPATGLPLLGRVVARSAYGAEKFGDQWRNRDNCKELCEETSDAVVYAAQETACVEMGLTPLTPGGDQAATAREHLAQAARQAAMADHFAQLAQAEIQGRAPGKK